MKKNLFALMLVITLMLTNTSVAFAKTNTSDVEHAKQTVEEIANGKDTLVGSGVPFDNPTVKDSGTITPQWTSGGPNHTHQYIVARALTILENDKGSSIAQYYYSSGSDTLLQNSDEPDEKENDLGTFCGHFYDPDTGKNFLGLTNPTALTRAISHAHTAQEAYWIDRTFSMQELGRALHYLDDINQPYHSANYIAGLTDHTQFEEWVDERRTSYTASSTTLYSLLNPSNFASDWIPYVNDIVIDSAKFSKSYINLAASTSQDKYSDWDKATQATLPHAQEITAAFLYNFLKAVGQI